MSAITMLQFEKLNQLAAFGKDMLAAGHSSKTNPISEEKIQEYFQRRSIPFFSHDEWKKLPFVMKEGASMYWINEDLLRKYEANSSGQYKLLMIICLAIILIPIYLFFFT